MLVLQARLTKQRTVNLGAEHTHSRGSVTSFSAQDSFTQTHLYTAKHFKISYPLLKEVSVQPCQLLYDIL